MVLVLVLSKYYPANGQIPSGGSSVRWHLIITTHSPTAVTAADPQALLLVRKEEDEAESTIDTVDVNATQQLRRSLSEVGASLSDVFGADNVLWVEGRTEEQCFPVILSRLANRPLLGTSRGEVQTGIYLAWSGRAATVEPGGRRGEGRHSRWDRSFTYSKDRAGVRTKSTRGRGERV
jgi:hypothetical protein